MKTESAYIRVYESIRNEIVNGTYAYGVKIPSKRVLAENYRVSVITAEHALDLLEEEGYIEKRERSGSYVSYRSEDILSFVETSRKHELFLPSEEELFPHSVYAKAVRSVLNEYGEELMLKTDSSGSFILREAIASYLKRSRDMNVSSDQIVIGSGSEYLYALVVGLLGTHRIYGIEDPSYEKIRAIYRSLAVRVDSLKLGDNGILTTELERTPASVLHVTPYNSYPSGRSADISKRQEYIRWAKAKDAYVIEDDYASELSSNLKVQKTLFALEPDSHVIYMNTFTKTIAPSIRVSYMVLPDKATPQFLEMLRFRSCTVSTLSQLTIAELLNNGSFERHLNRLRRKQRKDGHIGK